MSDEQHKKDEEAEVEGHRLKHPHASDEPSDEMENDDEVEAHRLRASRFTKN